MRIVGYHSRLMLPFYNPNLLSSIKNTPRQILVQPFTWWIQREKGKPRLDEQPVLRLLQYSSGTGCACRRRERLHKCPPPSLFDPHSIESLTETDKGKIKERQREWERHLRASRRPWTWLFLRESEKLPRSRRPRSHAIAILDAEYRRKRPTTTALGLSISFYLALSPLLSYLPAYMSTTTRCSTTRWRDMTHNPDVIINTIFPKLVSHF